MINDFNSPMAVALAASIKDIGSRGLLYGAESLHRFLTTDATAVMLLGAFLIFICCRASHPHPGPSFTYAWLAVGMLAHTLDNHDARIFFFDLGFGINLSWYTMQIIQKPFWECLLPYWGRILPRYCVEVILRSGDVMLHPIPFLSSFSFFPEVTLKHAVLSILYERFYFCCIDKYPIGDGSNTNKVYAASPSLAPHVYRSMQILSAIGYLFPTCVAAESLQEKTFSQSFWLTCLIVTCVLRGNRWSSVPSRIRSLQTQCLELIQNSEMRQNANLKKDLFAKFASDRITYLVECPVTPSKFQSFNFINLGSVQKGENIRNGFLNLNSRFSNMKLDAFGFPNNIGLQIRDYTSIQLQNFFSRHSSSEDGFQSLARFWRKGDSPAVSDGSENGDDETPVLKNEKVEIEKDDNEFEDLLYCDKNDEDNFNLKKNLEIDLDCLKCQGFTNESISTTVDEIETVRLYRSEVFEKPIESRSDMNEILSCSSDPCRSRIPLAPQRRIIVSSPLDGAADGRSK